MKYKSIYNEIEAICYTGYNFKEVNDFCDHRLSWSSETKDWVDSNPPVDLTIELTGDGQEPSNVVLPGNYIVRFSSEHYGVIEGYDFIRLFKE